MKQPMGQRLTWCEATNGAEANMVQGGPRWTKPKKACGGERSEVNKGWRLTRSAVTNGDMA